MKTAILELKSNTETHYLVELVSMKSFGSINFLGQVYKIKCNGFYRRQFCNFDENCNSFPSNR